MTFRPLAGKPLRILNKTASAIWPQGSIFLNSFWGIKALTTLLKLIESIVAIYDIWAAIYLSQVLTYKIKMISYSHV